MYYRESKLWTILLKSLRENYNSLNLGFFWKNKLMFMIIKGLRAVTNMKYDESTKLVFVHHMDTSCIDCFVVCFYEHPNKSLKR